MTNNKIHSGVIYILLPLLNKKYFFHRKTHLFAVQRRPQVTFTHAVDMKENTLMLLSLSTFLSHVKKTSSSQKVTLGLIWCVIWCKASVIYRRTPKSTHTYTHFNIHWLHLYIHQVTHPSFIHPPWVWMTLLLLLLLYCSDDPVVSSLSAAWGDPGVDPPPPPALLAAFPFSRWLLGWSECRWMSSSSWVPAVWPHSSHTYSLLRRSL